MSQNLMSLEFFALRFLAILNYQLITKLRGNKVTNHHVSMFQESPGEINKPHFSQTINIFVFDWSTHQNWLLHRSPPTSLAFQIRWPSSWVWFSALLFVCFLYQLTTFFVKISGRFWVTIFITILFFFLTQKLDLILNLNLFNAAEWFQLIKSNSLWLYVHFAPGQW